MANFKEIDLDTNLVIPMPKIGDLTKEQMAVMSARYSNYQQTIKSIEQKSFFGSEKEFEKMVEGKEQGVNFWVIEITKNNDELNVIYQELIEVINPISIVDYGIAQAIKPLGNYLREVIKFVQLEEEKLAVETKEKLVDEALTALDNIKAI